MNGTTAANPPLLQCTGLYKSYGRGNVLNGIDLTVSRGRIVGLLGPNGSGKTTLLKLIAGLLTPTAGEILVDGLEIGVETKKIVSYLPERTYFDDSMTVADTVTLFCDFYEDFDREKAYGSAVRREIPDALEGDEGEITAYPRHEPPCGALSSGRAYRRRRSGGKGFHP